MAPFFDTELPILANITGVLICTVILVGVLKGVWRGDIKHE